MPADTSPSKKIAEAAFITLAVTASIAAVFWSEILDAIGDSLNTSKTAVETRVDDEQFRTRRGGFELRPLRNDIELIQVSELRASTPTAVGVPVSFMLTNAGGANDFPSIRVHLTSASGRKMRAIDFRPSEYAHERRFDTQKVELLLSRQPGESGFTVEPYYGAHP